MEDRQRGTRRQFTAEFKGDAVELVRTSGRPIAEIARELGDLGLDQQLGGADGSDPGLGKQGRRHDRDELA
jgi:hypothetical protein